VNPGFFSFPNRQISNPAQRLWMLDASDAIRVDEYTAAGTYNGITAPSGANILTILAYGGGGGGMGGGAQTSTLAVGGGGGGGGGGTALLSMDLRDFPTHPAIRRPLTFQVAVGSGGAGGAGRNTTGSGNSGSSGNATSVNLTNSAGTVIMRLAFAGGGTGAFGSGGQRNGTGGWSTFQGGIQGTGATGGMRGQDGGGNPGWNSGGFRFPRQWSVGAYDIPTHPYICGGGGCGATINTDGLSRQQGGSGGTGYFWYEPYLESEGGTGAGRDGRLDDIVFAGVGGGGGYATIVSDNANAFNGGNGIRGGGGGGGGAIYMSASPGTYSSGAGGTGGTGYCLLLWTA
jgi:hypothetical protein